MKAVVCSTEAQRRNLKHSGDYEPDMVFLVAGLSPIRGYHFTEIIDATYYTPKTGKALERAADWWDYLQWSCATTDTVLTSRRGGK